MSKALKAAGLLATTIALAGCLEIKGPQQAALTTTTEQKAAQSAEYLNATSVKSATEGDSSTAVESALVWSEKYAHAVEKLVQLQQENRDLDDEIRQYGEANIKLQEELKQCQNELREANSMLVEMQAELEQWKRNVLGFRQEIREAQEAQLIALGRVLSLLGGELPENAALPTEATTTEETTQ